MSAALAEQLGFELDTSDGVNPPAPAQYPEFERELWRISRGSVRLVWGPEQIRYRMNGCTFRRYARQTTVAVTRGYCVMEGSRKVVAYLQPEDVQGYDFQPGQFLIPDIHWEQPGIRRWVLEQRLRDQYARENWERRRYKWLNGVRVDLLGPISEDGFWGFYSFLGEHDAERRCCTGMNREGKVCIGQYRQPDQRDLNEVAQSVWERDRRRLTPDSSQMQEEQEERDFESASEEAERKHDDYLTEMFREALDPLFTAIDSPKFDMGAFHRKAQCQGEL